MISFLLASWLLTQAPSAALSGEVVDSTGAAIVGAVVRVTSHGVTWSATSGADGRWSITAAEPPPYEVRITAPGFADRLSVVESVSASVRTVLTPQAIAERVTVSGGVSRLPVESSATIVRADAIAATPALALDDQLRLVPGFSLFRRTSSRVANPTTQGVTLRGLSASGASRTLVLADGVPLNDPFGAWVNWNRVPIAAIESLEVVRGSASDTHGDDALGGVIRVTTRSTPGGEVRAEAGDQSTARLSGFAGGRLHAISFGGSTEAFSTDGYRVVAPESRGPIDIEAGDRSRSAAGWMSGTASGVHLAARGGYYSEDRSNGTPAQINATISRWSAASASGTLAGGSYEARGDWTGSSYRQTFSAVAATRATERLTSLQWVGASSTGGTFSWLTTRGHASALVSAASRHWRADLEEAAIEVSGVQDPTVLTPAAQQSNSLAIQGRFDGTRYTLEAGARVESFRSGIRQRDDHQNADSVQPRVTGSWRLSDTTTLRASWLTGFRAATMNELFRSFRVGNTITQANDQLEPERSYGPELALTHTQHGWTLRGIVYETTLDHAVFNRTLQTGATIIRQRSNGDAQAIGAEAEAEWRVARGLSITSAWALNDSRFTSGELDGKRIPQVPRIQGSVGARISARRVNASVDIRAFSSQFDDDVNQFRLASGSVTDARVGWTIGRRCELFGAIENALDAEIDTGRTPIRTVGTPRIARAGVRLRF